MPHKTVALGTVLLLALGATIGVLYAQSTQTVTTDVQIEARRLDDGRIEFALNHEGERLLPRRRYFPATGGTTWLRSTAIPITIETQAPEPNIASADGPFEILDFKLLVTRTSRETRVFGFEATFRNDSSHQIRQGLLQVWAYNNAGYVWSCNPAYTTFCESAAANLTFNPARTVVEGGTFTVRNTAVRGWDENDDIERIELRISHLEYRSGPWNPFDYAQYDDLVAVAHRQ